MKSTYIWIGLGVLLLLLAFSGCGSYNNMVSKQEQVNKTWGDVQAAYQRRNDLIPNLVNTVKGSANFEQSTLTAVVEARAKATSINIDAKDLTDDKLKEFQQAQNQVSSSLSRLLVTVEQYPDIKTTEAFRDLNSQLEGTENRINKARTDFNGAVNSYNAYIRSFPQVLFAGVFGFTSKPYFQSDAGADKAPQVKF